MASDGRAPPSPTAQPGELFVPVPYTVDRSVTETADTVTLVLRPPRGVRVPTFSPGQFNMVYRFGVGEAAISISGDPARPEEVSHTIRSAGKVTAALARSIPGETLGLRGPYGLGWPLDRAVHKDVLIVAGGLGLPPLRPVLYELLAHRAQYERVEVVYGARSPKDLVHEGEIQRWRARDDLRFQVTVDAAGRDWYGDVGLVTARLPDTRLDPRNTVALLCGPEVMMRLTAQALEGMGVAPSSIWVSMERNMKCAVGLCGHCQWGPTFVCRDGPVFNYGATKPMFAVRDL